MYLAQRPDGFLKVFKGQINKDVIETLGKTWEVENMAQKYHASCHATHSPIEASLGIIKREELTPDAIKSIKIHSSQLAIDVAGKVEPSTGLEGKFSIAYCVANALLRGNTGMQAFTDDKVNDPLIKDFYKKISVVPDEDITQLESKVEVEANSGDVFSGFSNIIEEVPDFDVKKAKIKDKFTDLCMPVLGKNRTEELLEAVLSIENMDNMKGLTALV